MTWEICRRTGQQQGLDLLSLFHTLLRVGSSTTPFHLERILSRSCLFCSCCCCWYLHSEREICAADREIRGSHWACHHQDTNQPLIPKYQSSPSSLFLFTNSSAFHRSVQALAEILEKKPFVSFLTFVHQMIRPAFKPPFCSLPQ